MYSYDMHLSGRSISRYKQIIYFEKQLLIETYIIGYKSQGESILFFIKTDVGISFSGLIDCFCLKDIDKVRDVLEANKITALDFICWTHPDWDHSKGLKSIIDNYTSEKTHIWIPESVEMGEIKCSKEVRELFQYLKECTVNCSTEYNVYSTSDRKDMMCYNSISFRKDTNNFPLELVSYAPNSKLVRKQTYTDKYIKNDRSIFFVLSLGSVRIFFTGDIEDDTIEKIPANFFGEHIHIMKIPHHGSGSSVKMLDLGWDGCDIACSTVMRKGNDLPVKDVMEQYKKNAQLLLCTGKSNKEKEEEDYGVIRIITDVIENKFSIDTEGNAEIWNSISDVR